MRRVVSLLLSVLSLILRRGATATALPPSQSTDPVGVWPLRPTPEVVAGFDPPTTPWGAGHRGVDLLGHARQQVRAALAGTVSFVGMIAGAGSSSSTTATPARRTSRLLLALDPRAARGCRRRARLARPFPGSHCFPRSCLHWGWLAARPTSTRSASSGPARCACCHWRAPSPSPRPHPATPYAAWRPAHRPRGVGRVVVVTQARGCACR